MKRWKKITDTTERREIRLWSFSRCTRKADEGVWKFNLNSVSLWSICFHVLFHVFLSLFGERRKTSCFFVASCLLFLTWNQSVLSLFIRFLEVIPFDYGGTCWGEAFLDQKQQAKDTEVHALAWIFKLKKRSVLSAISLYHTMNNIYYLKKVYRMQTFHKTLIK